MAVYQVSHLLEKMASTDKDFRFMATNDLMSELQRDNIKLDDDSERKVVKMLLKLLEDKNGEVQNLAVKCLGPLINKVKEFHVELVVDTLCSNMVSKDEQLRDISSIGLKTVISEMSLNNSIASNVCKRIVGRIGSAVEKKTDVSVQLEALDILADLLSRFGPLLVSYHESIMHSLLPQLKSDRQAVRKRSILALSYMVLSCSQEHYKELMTHVMEALANEGSHTVITYVQCVSAICRQAGQRFTEYIDNVMNLILQHITAKDDDELHEHCLQAFESFVQQCPKEISAYIPKIVLLCLKYIAYDPNYNYDDGEDDNAMETEELANGEDEEEDSEYSDDDDITWKVRRSAAKCLESVIENRKDLITYMIKTVSAPLIERFKEREQNVKSDVFHTYITLLRQIKFNSGGSKTLDSIGEDESPVALLQTQVRPIVKSIYVQLREKSIRTRQDALALLKELLAVLPGCLTDHISILIPGIEFSLCKEKYSSSNMKIDALSFLNCLLSTHRAECFHPHVAVIVPLTVTAVGDSFYKIVAEALLVLQQIVKIIRPLDFPSNFDFVPHTNSIYQCTLLRLKTADIDQEVKEHAISCMSQIICNLGDYLKEEVPVCLKIFLDRLKNETTRLITVKAITKISNSPLHVDLKPLVGEGMPILASFLRKTNRALKLSTLVLLDSIINNYSSILTREMLIVVLQEVPPLISDSDLHITQLSFVMLCSVAKTQPLTISAVPNLWTETLTIVQSPLLQGGALSSMLEFLNALVNANLPQMPYEALLKMITDTVAESMHKQAYHNLANCVATLCSSKPREATLLVAQFVEEIKKQKCEDRTVFPLFVVGEIGKFIDTSNMPELKDVILQSLSSPSEEVKSAASYALGCMAIGNLQHYLPFILKQVELHSKKQYLLLHSLKDIICSQSTTEAGISQLQPYILDVWNQLYNHCDCPEEGTRNVVAECLGKLALINPTDLLPELQKGLYSPSALMRITALTAVKFTISDQPQAIDPLLKETMGAFEYLLQDKDYNVRRVAVTAFNSAAHNKPSLIRDKLNSILPQLYGETEIKKDLIREVEMGPFKHTVDDGLDIRKAAFECMYTLLDTCLDRLDIFEFLNHLEQGLKDHYDIKMLTYLMLMRLPQLAPTAVLQRLDRLVEPLKSTCMLKVKANSVKQEFEKQDELKRSALRTLNSLLTIPDADKNPSLKDFLSQLVTHNDLKVVWESVRTDAAVYNQDGHNGMEVN